MDSNCIFCQDKNREIIYHKEFEECGLEIFIEEDNSLAFNTYNHSSGFTEDIFDSFEINFCPMCGKKLKD